LAFMGYIIDWSTGATVYTNIAANQQWRQFYASKNRPIVYEDSVGQTSFKMEGSVPCVDCRMAVRENLITVDHQRPQAGNDLEPICKVFRAVGLTIAGPGGRKGIAVAGGLATKITGGPIPASGGSMDDRHSLNLAGAIYLTLIEGIGKTAEFKSMCLNHFVNLRPLCHSCNSPNRNVAHCT
jgi:hypothetical protein